MKKNILQFIGSFHQGGSERQAVQLTKLLHQDSTFNVFVATLNNEGVLREELENIGYSEIPEFKLSSFYDLNFFKQLRRCVKFLKENKIEIVHTHDFYTNVFGMFAARIAGVKLLIASKRETGGMRSNLQKNIEKIAFWFAKKIVVNSLAVKDYLITEGVSSDKIKIIYNGLDLNRLAPKISNRIEICKELNLPVSNVLKFVSMVANLRHEVKNQPMFLRVAQKVCAKVSDARFVLAGEGELLESLQKLASELQIAEKVEFIGRCSKVPELLSISTVCVLTSFNEGFSNSILEYMAAGKPVVATNVGGAKEAIIEGETGYLVKSDDAEAMANHLVKLLESADLPKLIGENAQKAVNERFTLEAQLRETKSLYTNGI